MKPLTLLPLVSLFSCSDQRSKSETISNTKKGTEGSELGLSITHDTIKSHQGSIEIKSLPGKRTAFTIRLEQSNRHGH